MGVWDIRFKERTVTIYDSGNELWSACSLPFVGRAVAEVLKHEEETKNKFLDVVEFQTTQNAVIGAFEEELGANFQIKHVTTADVEKTGHEAVAKGDPHAFMHFLYLWGFADGGNHAVPDSETGNKLLGLPEPKTDARGEVKAYVKSRGL